MFANGRVRNIKDPTEDPPKRITSGRVGNLIGVMTTAKKARLIFVAKSRVGAPVITDCPHMREDGCKPQPVSGLPVAIQYKGHSREGVILPKILAHTPMVELIKVIGGVSSASNLYGSF